MLKHETQAALLKALIALEDGEESRQLRASLTKADRERKRICHAMLLMATLFILSLAGLGYCVLLLRQTIYNPTHFVTTSLSVLGLASLISQLEFFGYLLWHRVRVGRLHKECRRRVLLLAESQLSASPRRSLSADNV
jgi:cytochrome c biogenesis protein CcdA